MEEEFKCRSAVRKVEAVSKFSILVLHLLVGVSPLIAFEEKSRAWWLITCPIVLSGIAYFFMLAAVQGRKRFIPAAVGLLVAAMYALSVQLFFSSSTSEAIIGSAITLLFTVWVYAVFSIGISVFLYFTERKHQLTFKS